MSKLQFQRLKDDFLPISSRWSWLASPLEMPRVSSLPVVRLVLLHSSWSWMWDLNEALVMVLICWRPSPGSSSSGSSLSPSFNPCSGSISSQECYWKSGQWDLALITGFDRAWQHLQQSSHGLVLPRALRSYIMFTNLHFTVVHFSAIWFYSLIPGWRMCLWNLRRLSKT